MRKFVLLDEDAWVVPDVWRQDMHPRRGGHPVPERVIPPREGVKSLLARA
jgi:hypothetical protein